MARPPRSAKSETADRLTRGDWIAAALKALAEGGVASVRVESLAKALEVTKGSFYWHFVDRNDLLNNMLEAWRLDLTASVAERIKRKAADPKARLSFLLKLSTTDERNVPGGLTEQAIREWAKTSEMARVAMARVDRDRLEILTGLYRDLGFRDQAARAKAVLFLAYVIGVNSLMRDLINDDLRAERDLCVALLTAID